MAQQRDFSGRQKASVGMRLCPRCGVPMIFVCIGPTDQADHDQRTFECSTCPYDEAVAVKYRSHAPIELD